MFETINNIFAAADFAGIMLDSITVTVVGMGIVILALSVMGVVFKLLGHWFVSPPPVEDQLPTTSANIVSCSNPESEPLSPDSRCKDLKLVVILAAAATAMLGRRVRIRRITFINHNTVSGWAEAGRISIQTSHNIRRK